MRLDKLEREALKFVLKDFKGEIYLFGSRLDDDKRGGDIYPAPSPVIKSKEEVNYDSPLFLDMTENVKIFYDKEDFFKNYLDTLRKKLSALGAKKNLW